MESEEKESCLAVFLWLVVSCLASLYVMALLVRVAVGW